MSERRALLGQLTDRELDAFALIVRELAAKNGTNAGEGGRA